MNKEYAEMELNVLTCLILEPELMSKMFLDEKYFITYKRLWKYMKSFYEKYKTFDIGLMCSLCGAKKI